MFYQKNILNEMIKGSSPLAIFLISTLGKEIQTIRRRAKKEQKGISTDLQNISTVSKIVAYCRKEKQLTVSKVLTAEGIEIMQTIINGDVQKIIGN